MFGGWYPNEFALALGGRPLIFWSPERHHHGEGSVLHYDSDCCERESETLTFSLYDLVIQDAKSDKYYPLSSSFDSEL